MVCFDAWIYLLNRQLGFICEADNQICSNWFPHRYLEHAIPCCCFKSRQYPVLYLVPYEIVNNLVYDWTVVSAHSSVQPKKTVSGQ